MKRLNYFLSACFFLLSFYTKAQAPALAVNVGKADMAKVFEKMNTWFRNTPSYSLVVTHASYENYTTAVPVEKSVGYFKKDKDNYHSFLIGIHTVQNAKYKFVIDTAEKMILVANPDQLAWSSYTPEDYEALLKNYTTIKVSARGADKNYRIELPADFPIGAYEFLVDAEGRPKQVVWYYNQEVKKDDSDENSKVKPRVSISFSGYKENVAFSFKEEFGDETYFVKKNNKLVATSRYQDYKLSDQRLRN